MAVPQASPPTDPRRSTCLACLTRPCCARRVPLTLPEFAAIARTLAVPPSSFAELAPASFDHPAPLASASGGRHILLRQRDGLCAFLLHLGSGRRLCGLGDLAPASCKDFPRAPDLRGGLAPGCPEPWSDLPEGHRTADPQHLQDLKDLKDLHDRLVARWNALDADALPDDASTLDAMIALAASEVLPPSPTPSEPLPGVAPRSPR